MFIFAQVICYEIGVCGLKKDFLPYGYVVVMLILIKKYSYAEKLLQDRVPEFEAQ